MKLFLHKRLWFALALTATLPALNLAAAEPIPGTVASVTLKLTIMTTEDGTMKKDPTTGKPIKGVGAGRDFKNKWAITKNGKVTEEGQETVYKAVTTKYSNKEFLQDMKDLGLITSIKGWAVSRVQGMKEPLPEGEDIIVTANPGPVHFYLTHKSLPPIQINSRFYLLGYADESGADEDSGGGFGDLFSPLQAQTTRQIVKYNKNGTVVSDTRTHQISYNSIGELMIGLSYEKTVGEDTYQVGEVISLMGVIKGGEKLGFYKPDQRQVIVPTASKIASVYGMMMDADEEEKIFKISMLEGVASYSTGAIKNVAAFPKIMENPSIFDPDELSEHE